MIEYCNTGRTMAELLAAGFTRDQVYGAVKRGALLNTRRRDAWGRTQHGAGLFVNPNPPAAYDARALVQAWGRT